MKRIGILGGTFNPIHNGHLAMAQAAYEGYQLDQVIFMPSNIPVHKKAKGIVTARRRFRMVELAVAPYRHFKADDCEIKRKGRSYTYDSVIAFKNQLSKKDRLFFIIGSDNLQGLSSWYKINELVEIMTFICVNRPGCKMAKTAIPYERVEMPDIDIASSVIRQRVAANQEVRYLMPCDVFDYIRRNRIYK